MTITLLSQGTIIRHQEGIYVLPAATPAIWHLGTGRALVQQSARPSEPQSHLCLAEARLASW